MIFCAKFYFSAQMATMAIGNANPAHILLWLNDVTYCKMADNMKLLIIFLIKSQLTLISIPEDII